MICSETVHDTLPSFVLTHMDCESKAAPPATSLASRRKLKTGKVGKLVPSGICSDRNHADPIKLTTMAAELGANSLRYLPTAAIAQAIGKPESDLCQACITGDYPTAAGQRLYQLALSQNGCGNGRRTYE